MNIDCNYVHQNLHLHKEDSFDDHERYSIRQHISECEECQDYFEELIYTENLLSNLSSPVPPDGLLDNIKLELRKYQKPTFFDWISYPVSRIFSVLHIDLKPIFVNSSALVLYIIIGLFITKLIFLFNDSNSIHPTKPVVRPKQRVITFAEIKKSALSEVILDVGDKDKDIDSESEENGGAESESPASVFDQNNE